jgi:hypothetical protein
MRTFFVGLPTHTLGDFREPLGEKNHSARPHLRHICCKLDQEQNGHSGFSDWYDTNSQAIDEVVTHEVVTEYFALKGEGKHILSKQLSQRIIERMKITA